MAIVDLVSAERLTPDQYLHMSFEYDAEFVEGRIVERSMPTWEHGRVQGFLIRVLGDMEAGLGFYAVPEQRVRTREDRFRIPDVCVLLEKPAGRMGGRIVTLPPYLCIEILSPEDSMADTLEKVREYLAFGVAWVWIIDPVTCTGQIHTHAGIVAVEDRIFTTDRFQVNLTDVDL